MSLYPVSNFNIGTGVATEVLDSISSSDGSLVVTFTDGIATFTNPITGTILYAINIQITSDNLSFGNFPLIYVKSNSSGYEPVYIANSKIYINPASGTLFADEIQATNQISIGVSGDYWSASGLHLANNSVDGVRNFNILDQTNILNYWDVYSLANQLTFDYNGVNKMTLSNSGLLQVGFATTLLNNNGVRLYERGPSGVYSGYYTMYDYLSYFNIEGNIPSGAGFSPFLLSPTGYLSIGGTSAQIRLTSQTEPANYNLTIYHNGTGTRLEGNSSGYVWSLVQDRTGLVVIDGSTGCGLKINDRTNAYAWTFIPTGNIMYFQYNGATNVNTMTLSSIGNLTLTGTEAQLTLKSITAGSTDYWDITASGSTGQADLFFEYNGVSRMNITDAGRLSLTGTNAGLIIPDQNTPVNIWGLSSSGDKLRTYSYINNYDVSQLDAVVSIVGLGTTYNSTQLQICNSGGDGAIQLFNTTAKVGLFYNSTPDRLFACNTGVSGTAGPYLSANATNWITSSDRRMKNNIVPLPSGSLDKILKLNPVSFNWNDEDNNNTECGLIAQEVLEIIPEVVENPTDPETMMGINYNQLIPFLIKSIQELTERIKELEKLNNF